MDQTTANTPLNLGFLTVFQEANGYVGGFLVTNKWGRPLEFRLSTAVQPNRVHHILYGDTLVPYICADLIGKTLIDKTTVPVQMIVTDREPVLDVRLRLEIPVVWLAPAGDPGIAKLSMAGAEIRPAAKGIAPLYCHPQSLKDIDSARSILESFAGAIDLTEPFSRIKEAIAEARKTGVSARVA